MLSYDVNKPNNYITYLDANNFYGYAMSKNLPYGGLKWLNQKEIDRFDVNSIGKDSSVGVKVGGVNKLVPNVGNKSEYVVHYRNLKLYLSLGMKFTKVHKDLKLKQSDWLIC